MAEWIQLPSKPLFYQKAQRDYIEARRARYCRKCKFEYQAVPPVRECPKCGKLDGSKRLFSFLTLIAGRRFGKTRISAISAVDEACYPNSLVWCCAPTNPKLHRYVIPAVQELIPPDWVQNYSVEHQDLYLKNGSMIHFQTLEHPDQGRGQGLTALWIDEVCEITLKHWDTIRPSLAGDTVAFFSTTPRSYDWVYKELYKKALDEIPGYWGAIAKSADSANPDLSPEFLARERAAMSDTMFRQEYEADFVNFTGSVYGSLLTPQILHTHDEIRKIIPEWPNIDQWRQVIVGIDTGADHPFGGVKIVSTERGLVVVGEYLRRDGSYIEHSAGLKRLANHSSPKWAINKNERQGIIELAQHGILCQRAENDVISGIERIKSALYSKQLWFAEPVCPRTVQQMMAYRWDDNYSPTDQQKLKERVYKVDDELPDCIRYALLTWPRLPSGPPIEEVKPRDISKLDDKTRSYLELMRRIDAEPKNPEESTVAADFWL